MTDIENAINDALAEAIGQDADLLDQVAAVAHAEAWNSIAPPHLQKSPGEILAGFKMTPREIARKLGLDEEETEEFMNGDPDDMFEISPTAAHGFDDVFGRPTE